MTMARVALTPTEDRISLQEAFDRVVIHLSTMDHRSLTQRSPILRVTCAYRGEGGRKCAIGALIPDEMYSPSMENLPASEPLVADVMEKIIDPGRVRLRDFTSRLQVIHDSHGNWGPTRFTGFDMMLDVAREFSLDPHQVYAAMESVDRPADGSVGSPS